MARITLPSTTRIVLIQGETSVTPVFHILRVHALSRMVKKERIEFSIVTVTHLVS